MTDFQKESLFLQNIRPEGVRRESLAVSVPRSVELATDLGDDLIETEDGIFPAGVNVTQAKFRMGGGMRGRGAMRRGRPSAGKGRGAGRKSSSEIARAGLRHQGFSWRGAAQEMAVPTIVATGLLQNAGWAVAMSSKFAAFLTFVGAESLTIGALLGLALIPGVGGAAYWALKKVIKNIPGRALATLGAPGTVKWFNDTVSSIWLFLDKTAYQFAQTGVANGKKSVPHWLGAIVSVPAYAYMAYRFANTAASGLLDTIVTLNPREGLPKMYNGAMGLLNMFTMGRPEIYYNALIKDEENDIDSNRTALKFGNWMIKKSRDPDLDADELDRDGEIGEPGTADYVPNRHTAVKTDEQKPAHA